MRRKVALWTGGIGTGGSAGTRGSAISDTLASVASPVELFGGMIEVDANFRIGDGSQRVQMCELN